jgi:purine-binding chemotaxis protein CheW
MATTIEAIEQMQYLTFQLAGEEYAIGILRVREIIEYDVVTTVPTAPAHIRGVINLRGSVVPVVDLAVKFGLAPTTVTRRTCIVIVEADLDGDRTVMGVMADAVSSVVDMLPGDIEPPPSFGTRARVEHLVGLGRLGRKFALILDIDRLLSTLELSSAAAATEAAVPAAVAGVATS